MFDFARARARAPAPRAKARRCAIETSRSAVCASRAGHAACAFFSGPFSAAPASVSFLLCSLMLAACLQVTRVTPPAYSEPGRSVSIHLPGTGLKARRDDRVRSAQWHRRRSTAVTLDEQRAIGNSRLLHSLSIQLRLINEKSLASFPVIRWNRKSMTQNPPVLGFVFTSSFSPHPSFFSSAAPSWNTQTQSAKPHFPDAIQPLSGDSGFHRSNCSCGG